MEHEKIGLINEKNKSKNRFNRHKMNNEYLKDLIENIFVIIPFK